MTEKPDYYDIRSEFWKKCFEEAAGYEEYLDQSPEDNRERWVAMGEQLPKLMKEQKERLVGYGRELNVLMYSGVWCGDCVRQEPMIKKIVDACEEGVRLKIIDRDANEELKDELRVLGAMRVPIVVFLSEDYFEVGRFGDRLLNVYRRKYERETGEASLTGLIAPPVEELTEEQGEWVDIFERMLLMARLSPPLRRRHGD